MSVAGASGPRTATFMCGVPVPRAARGGPDAVESVAAPDRIEALAIASRYDAILLDQFGVLCDLAWDDIAPYPANATPPGSMLRLTASDACANFPLGGGLCERVVSADFLYTTFETTDGAMRVAPATFAGGARTMPLRRFEEKAAAAIDARCVRTREVESPVEAT